MEDHFRWLIFDFGFLIVIGCVSALLHLTDICLLDRAIRYTPLIFHHHIRSPIRNRQHLHCNRSAEQVSAIKNLMVLLKDHIRQIATRIAAHLDVDDGR
jgi:hypothetical protein